MVSINDRRRQSPLMFPAALANSKETKLSSVLLPVQIACGVFRQRVGMSFSNRSHSAACVQEMGFKQT